MATTLAESGEKELMSHDQELEIKIDTYSLALLAQGHAVNFVAKTPDGGGLLMELKAMKMQYLGAKH